MRKVVLFFMALCVAAVSCEKSTKIPVSYSVETDKNTPLKDITIPDSGTYAMPVLVKFLTGYHNDKVTISLKGLPADIKVDTTAASGIPTYSKTFVFTTKGAAHGTYPLTLSASAPGTATKYYTFRLTVGEADCASLLAGTYSCSNACSARSFTYTSTCTANGPAALDFVNFGGYGSATSMRATLNCYKDSIFIASQNIGNGTVLSGYGTFNGGKLTIIYTATSTPGGFPESCTATLVKQ